MSKKQALKILEDMPDKEFNAFLDNLPYRVQLLVKAHFVDWQEVLPQWYILSAEKSPVNAGSI